MGQFVLFFLEMICWFLIVIVLPLRFFGAILCGFEYSRAKYKLWEFWEQLSKLFDKAVSRVSVLE
jgi:hypothetical protein